MKTKKEKLVEEMWACLCKRDDGSSFFLSTREIIDDQEYTGIAIYPLRSTAKKFCDYMKPGRIFAKPVRVEVREL